MSEYAFDDDVFDTGWTSVQARARTLLVAPRTRTRVQRTRVASALHAASKGVWTNSQTSLACRGAAQTVASHKLRKRSHTVVRVVEVRVPARPAALGTRGAARTHTRVMFR